MKWVNIVTIKLLLNFIQNQLTKKQFIFLASICVGLIVGIAAVTLKIFVHLIYITAIRSELGQYKYFYVLLPIIGIFLTVLIIKKIFKDKLVKGLSQIHYNIANQSSNLPKVQTYAQIITSSLSIGFGGSAGLEAPIVITGAAIGSNFGKISRLNYADKTLLLACGIAAGIGATFNAPIAGVLFALEVLLIDISISAFIPLIIAAATGALISKIFLLDKILLSFTLQQPFDYKNVPFYIVLGLLAGIVSVHHSRTFTKIENLFNKENPYQNVFVGGSILAILILIFPTLFGEGYMSIQNIALDPESVLRNSVFENIYKNEWLLLIFIGVLVLVKSVATGLTLGSGGVGGNFAPSLFVGAYLGFFFSKLVNLLKITVLPESNFTLVGMAGILSGLYHAPLTAIFLIAEITGGYTLMIPLMIVSSIAFAISRYFEPHSMDTKKYAISGKIFTTDKEHNILSTIDAKSLIKSDFSTLSPDESFLSLVDKIAHSKRNIFPVIDTENQLIGIVFLDDVREKIFKTDIYSSETVKDLMVDSLAVIDINDSMELIMNKFDNTGVWNLPVLDNGEYLGFISKSSVFSNYRERLKSSTIG